MGKLKSTIPENDSGDFYDQQMEKIFWPSIPPNPTKWGSAKGMAEAIDTDSYKEDFYDQQEEAIPPKLADTNLKTLAAANKPRLSDVPPVALFALGAAMSNGKDKYDRFNWRETGSTASVFYDAIFRHLADWYNGEDHADDSKVHHLGHIMASCAILLDSEIHGKLNDDRGDYGSVSRHPEYWVDGKN
jgi:hypothetical protein